MTRILIMLCCFLLPKAVISQDVNLFFTSGSDKLRSADLAKLNEIISQYKRIPGDLVLKGHADSTGKTSYNMDLSKRRALSVKSYLVSQHVNPKDIFIEFYGEKEAHTDDQMYHRRVAVSFTSAGKTIRNYSELIQSITPAKEVFAIPSGRATLIEGKKGTVVSIPPNAFRYGNGQPVTGEVKIELAEYYSMSDFISQRLGTLCGDDLLVSGGVVNIRARQDTTEVFLNESTEIDIDFPRSSDSRFLTFYGDRIEDGSIDWQLDTVLARRQQGPIGVTLATNGRGLVVTDRVTADRRNRLLAEGTEVFDITSGRTRAMTTEEKQERQDLQNYYSTLNSRRLGWINCDIFLRDPSTTPIDYYVKVTNPGATALEVFLIFSGLNSLVQMPVKPGQKINYIYANLPIKRPVKLLVSGMVNGKIHLFYKDVKLAHNRTEQITLKQSSLQELSRVLQSL